MPRGAGRHFLRRFVFRFLCCLSLCIMCVDYRDHPWWMSALNGPFRPLKLSVFLRKWAVRVDISHTSVPIGQRKERAA